MFCLFCLTHWVYMGCHGKVGTVHLTSDLTAPIAYISLIPFQLTWMQSTQLFLLPFCHIKLVGPFSTDRTSKRHFHLDNNRSLDILLDRFSVNPATFNVTEITFLLQQVILTMFTWFNALIYCHVIGHLDNCINLQLNRCTSKSDRREVRTCKCSICVNRLNLFNTLGPNEETSQIQIPELSSTFVESEF